MKLRMLLLALLFFMFSYGTSLKAQDATTAEVQVDPASVLCAVLKKASKSCTTCNNLDDAKKCFAALPAGSLGTACNGGCNRVVCKVPALQNLCMQYCCPQYKGKISSCLSQNGGKTCP